MVRTATDEGLGAFGRGIALSLGRFQHALDGASSSARPGKGKVNATARHADAGAGRRARKLNCLA